jgi:hypothetical protein
MDHVKKGSTLLLLLPLLLLAACATAPKHKVHYTQLDRPRTDDTVYPVLLLTPDIAVKEMSAGGLSQEVEAWSKEAEAHIGQALRDSSGHLGKLRPVALPRLLEEERQLLEQHQILYDTVAGAALVHSMGAGDAAWEHKIDHFDYTLGPGLAFLAEKSGVDRALIITGEDVISTSGRKAAFVVAAALGVGIPLGHTVLIGGIVDLRTGDLHWLNYSVGQDGRSLRDQDGAKSLLQGLFEDFPGTEVYLRRRTTAKR